MAVSLLKRPKAMRRFQNWHWTLNFSNVAHKTAFPRIHVFCVWSVCASLSKLLAIVGLILINVDLAKSGLGRWIFDSKLSRGVWETLLTCGNSILFDSPVFPVICSGSSGFSFECFPFEHPGVFRNSVKSVHCFWRKNCCRHWVHIQTRCCYYVLIC